VASWGEAFAVAYLRRAGVSVIGRNVRVGRGELDIVGVDGGTRVAFEVKTMRVLHRDDDPLLRADEAKLRHVRSAAARLRPPIHRVDVVAIGIEASGVSVRWVRDAAW